MASQNTSSPTNGLVDPQRIEHTQYPINYHGILFNYSTHPILSSSPSTRLRIHYFKALHVGEGAGPPD
jgi:hypothetical protein